MAGELVLVTGASGHVGFRTLVETLAAGYRARAAVRNEAAANKIKRAASIQPYLNQLSFVYVPDFEKEGAYNEAVKDVDFIIHLASPTPYQEVSPEDRRAIIADPAINATVNLLRTAKKYSPTTRRIVVTTSIVALLPWADFWSESGKVFTEESRTPFAPGPYDSNFEAYGAGKVGALLATDKFLEEEKPHFTINSVAPAFVIGKNELVTSPEDVISGTNGSAFGHVLGINPGPTPSSSVYLNDIARTHVLALSPSIPQNKVYIGISDDSNTRWEDSLDIAKKYYPEAVASGLLPLGGENPTKRVIFDNSWTRKTLGQEFVPYEQQVKSVTDHYLELKKAATAA